MEKKRKKRKKENEKKLSFISPPLQSGLYRVQVKEHAVKNVQYYCEYKRTNEDAVQAVVFKIPAALQYFDSSFMLRAWKITDYVTRRVTKNGRTYF